MPLTPSVVAAYERMLPSAMPLSGQGRRRKEVATGGRLTSRSCPAGTSPCRQVRALNRRSLWHSTRRRGSQFKRPSRPMPFRDVRDSLIATIWHEFGATSGAADAYRPASQA